LAALVQECLGSRSRSGRTQLVGEIVDGPSSGPVRVEAVLMAESLPVLLSIDNKSTLLAMPRKSQSPDGGRAPRRTRSDIRESLLESGPRRVSGPRASMARRPGRIAGACPRAPARRSAITSSRRRPLWTAAVDHLFRVTAGKRSTASSSAELIGRRTWQELAAAFAEAIRGFVRFAAEAPPSSSRS